ncbi:MAG: PqqD family protein [Candidatus Omnitrophota bacterium]
MRFKLNSPYVAYDVVEGEVVIVNLHRGHYYSIRGSGVDVWVGFVSGLSIDEVIRKIEHGYVAERKEIEASVQELLEAFKKDEFLVPVSEEDMKERAAPVPDCSSDAAAADKKPFVPSRIEKFTDMEDILLLDPIHDVDDKGWPHRSNKTGQ